MIAKENHMADQRSTIAGSERSTPPGTDAGDIKPDAVAQVSVYLKTPQTNLPPTSSGFRTRSDLRAEREMSLRDQISRLQAFAEGVGLKVVEADPGRRLVKIEGTLSALQSAFGTQLRQYNHQGQTFRARSGPLTAPSDVADMVEAVLGLDERPIATPKLVRLANASTTAGFLPNQVTRLYGFPSPNGAGSGECIGIIELGGGFNDSDTAAAFKAMNLSPPKVTAVAVSGGSNAPGKDTDSDGEVALDIQVSGAGAPGATIAVYFATNTDQGFVDAISQAAHDETNKPSVLSISWGSAESGWTQQAVTAMTSAFQDAVDLGVSVFAASGDGLATDGVSDGKAHVDFPASSPLVVGCGGTHIDASAEEITGETVWNSDGGGSGGGISDLFDVPTYQDEVTLPPSVNAGRKGRGVPDVAGDADPNSGYRVVVDGQAQVIGGTSAVAPLWAGLFALINATTGRPSGQPHAVLYANPSAFRDTT
ncbi:MAG: S53 family peptidase, partial [Caulobacteraceae bacterium]